MRTAIDILPDAFAEVLDSGPELQSVIEGHHNLLLEGPPDWTEAVLGSLIPLLRGPVTWTTSQMLLPAGECGGTLVVQDVSALSRNDQARLSDWLHHGGRQVISTTTRPLFPAVAQSSFDEALYYRLNVIRVCAS